MEAALDILADFITEAGEILAQLNEQLPALEQAPGDRELLNAVFRGFHTIKGGAGFIGATAMVEICHRAEDVFNLLRQGRRAVDARTMDAALQVLDILSAMFGALRAGNPIAAARRDLLAELAALAQPDEPSTMVTAPARAEKELSDSELEALFESAARGAGTSDSAPAPAGDTISEDEFDMLLDQLRGGGNAPKAQLSAAAALALSTPAATPATLAPATAAAPAHTPAPPDTSVRVDTRRLDDLMNLVGELVLVRNRLSSMQGVCGGEEAVKAIASLDAVTSALQGAVMKARMQPVKKLFARFPRVIRDLARTLRKDVELDLFGQETDLDKNLVEALADPLVHLLRNAVDHGIEPPDDRAAAGKPRTGRIRLGARQEGDRILLIVEDDGRGMDANLLRRKAVEKGLLSADAAGRMSDHDAFGLIFAPGFSTKSEISEVSGRGVGMDVVKTRIAQINGAVDITSELGRGSRITIRLPLTLAILPTLMVVVNGRRFALPLGAVDEILDLAPDATYRVDGQELTTVREKPLPMIRLRHWVGGEPPGAELKDMCYLVVVQTGGERVGLAVDQLIGREEVVIKPLSAFLHGLPGVSGATITGDGRLALILDVRGLVMSYARGLMSESKALAW